VKLATAKKLFLSLGVLLAVITGSFLYVQLGTGEGALGLNITASYATFTVNESGKIIVAGREQSILLDGIKTVAVNKTALFYDVTGDTLRYMRVKTYKNSPAIVSEKWTFNSASNDITLFPVKHEIEVTNAAGLTLRYKVDKLTGAKAHVAKSPERFGHQMSVEFQPGYKTAKVYSGYMQVDYPVLSASQTFNVRLFDPPCVTPTSGYKINLSGVYTFCGDSSTIYYINDTSTLGAVYVGTGSANNVVIDCNNTLLQGNGSGKAIGAINDNNITVQNCRTNNWGNSLGFQNINVLNIINISVNQSYHEGIYINSANNTLVDNVIVNNTLDSSNLSHGLYLSTAVNSVENITVRNSVFDNIRGQAIHFNALGTYYSRNADIYNNVLSNGPSFIAFTFWGSRGGKFHDNNISNFYNCVWFSSNAGNYLNETSQNNIVYNNRFNCTNNAVVSVFGAKNNTVTNNTYLGSKRFTIRTNTTQGSDGLIVNESGLDSALIYYDNSFGYPGASFNLTYSGTKFFNITNGSTSICSSLNCQNYTPSAGQVWNVSRYDACYMPESSAAKINVTVPACYGNYGVNGTSYLNILASQINVQNGYATVKPFNVSGLVTPYNNAYNVTGNRLIASNIAGLNVNLNPGNTIVIGDLYGVPSNINNFNITFNNTYADAVYCVDFNTEAAS
jgi:hypothetical protein